MKRRILSLCLFLGACSTATSVPTPIDNAPPKPKPTHEAKDETKPAPTPTPKPAQVTYATFADWRAAFVTKAVAQGFERTFVENILADVQPRAAIVQADSGQPEFSKPISAYVKNAVSNARVEGGRTRLSANPDVPAIEAKYGVPREVLGGIWGMESDFGRVQGDIDVVTAFATLAFDGRRRDWAETQLLTVLTIIKTGKATREELKGSWAGAMGQTQFLPENYLKLGQDGDGNGHVDIWKSDSDALASAANLLRKEGWRPGQAWAVEVTIPAGFDYYLSETETQNPVWWAEKGVVRADGGTWNESEKAAPAVLILPSGAKGPAFLALPNHYVIRKYNNSTAYALAVGLNADGMAGKGALKAPWPEEQPLSIAQRKGTQTALNAAGFNVGAVDGVIGVGTRKALREWQKANGRVADGYLSYELANELSAKTTGYTILGPSSQ
ncbi:lytic murein transglycosylase [Asticcacaulis sp. BYS171W]|uniref:Lytic murein transglycosylase n=1 Tax=Asticcacaulis aquaticus TaxID=2984212 RepID=A0ABT5HTX5_9CAUL|nr:lytic murein transglycosylase [Asticcacaulis aquaticus]MDC7683521.1 lytic murein transglycosylase [Asticcacaulis aquaticus]